MGKGRRAASTAVIVGALAGCSLTTSLGGFSSGGDEAEDAGGEAAVPSTEAAADAGADSLLQDVAVDVVDGCSLSGCFDMPQGFELVAYGEDKKGAACPSGFTTLSDTVEGPSLLSGACTCGSCAITKAPTCANGTILGRYGTSGAGTCPTSGGNMANTNNACGTDGFLGPFGTGNEHRYTPPAASGATCQVSAVKDDAKLAFEHRGRLCQATSVPQCEGKTCLPAVSAGFAACIGAEGDVPCPSSFPKKHLVGADATFSCGSGCTCQVTATCKGKLRFYTSANCSGAFAAEVPVDDLCQPTDFAGVTYGSHLYVADPPVNTACNKGGSTSPSTPSLTLKGTICCN